MLPALRWSLTVVFCVAQNREIVMLTTQQVEQFNTRGYTVCPCFLSAAQVDALLAETARATRGHTLAEHDSERMEMEP